MADGKRSTDEEQLDEKKYFQKVLDDVVSLNSLFTIAVFIGLSFAQPGQVQSLNDDPSCDSDTNLRKRLVAFEIASFSCFIFSGVLAKTVKIFLYTSEKQDARNKEQNGNKDSSNSKDVKADLYTSEKQDTLNKEQNGNKDSSNSKDVKAYRKWKSLVGFYWSIYGTMVGCFLLLLAMVDVVQIKLGRLSCHSKFTVTTVCVMVTIIGLSLLIFLYEVSKGARIAYAEITKQIGKKQVPVPQGPQNV